MKLFFTIFVVLFAAFGSMLAKDKIILRDRMLTVGQWSDHEGIVWVVQKEKIVVYRAYDSFERSDELIFERALLPEELARIGGAIKSIPKDAFGCMYSDEYSMHSPSLTFIFTADGSASSEMIEICTLIYPWARKINDEISALLPVVQQISYENLIRNWPQRHNLTPREVVIRKRTFKDIVAQISEKPRKPIEKREYEIKDKDVGGESKPK